MTAITFTAKTATDRFDSIFAAVIGACAEFCAGARQGRDIETRYHVLSRRSTPDLAQLGLTRGDIARAALTGKPH